MSPTLPLSIARKISDDNLRIAVCRMVLIVGRLKFRHQIVRNQVQSKLKKHNSLNDFGKNWQILYKSIRQEEGSRFPFFATGVVSALFHVEGHLLDVKNTLKKYTMNGTRRSVQLFKMFVRKGSLGQDLFCLWMVKTRSKTLTSEKC